MTMASRTTENKMAKRLSRRVLLMEWLKTNGSSSLAIPPTNSFQASRWVNRACHEALQFFASLWRLILGWSGIG